MRLRDAFFMQVCRHVFTIDVFTRNAFVNNCNRACFVISILSFYLFTKYFKMKFKVKFFCKLRVDSKKRKRVVIHSICRTAKSLKYKFEPEDQELSMHTPGVRKAIIDADVRSKKHVEYTLKDDEVVFYINPQTSQYWFNGKELEKIDARKVSNKPSEDQEDIPSAAGLTSTRTLH